MEQNKDNYSEINNVPDNPYSEYYQEYIADPEQVKKEVSKARRVASTITCAASDAIVLTLGGMWTYFFVSAASYSSEINVDGIFAFTLLFLIYFLPALALSIVAKCINHKSKWALINIICISVFMGLMIALSFVLQAFN